MRVSVIRVVLYELCCTSVCCTRVVLYELSTGSQAGIAKQKVRKEHAKLSVGHVLGSTRAQQESKFTGTEALKKLMGHDAGVNMFAQYLKREFSLENLIAFVEFFQYIKYALLVPEENFNTWGKTGPRRKSTRDASRGLADFSGQLAHNDDRLKLAPSIPLSLINNLPDGVTWKEKYELLHQKYMSEQANFELNVVCSFTCVCA